MLEIAIDGAPVLMVNSTLEATGDEDEPKAGELAVENSICEVAIEDEKPARVELPMVLELAAAKLLDNNVAEL
jgi:hypothetical protein